MLGISIDESHRANFSGPRNKYERIIYPLLDDKISRKNCEEIIKNHGWPLPRKSGCDFCPFQNRKAFRALSQNYPDRFKKIMKMEMAGKDYPNSVLRDLPLVNLTKNQSMDDFVDEEESCDSGYCFR